MVAKKNDIEDLYMEYYYLRKKGRVQSLFKKRGTLSERANSGKRPDIIGRNRSQVKDQSEKVRLLKSESASDMVKVESKLGRKFASIANSEYFAQTDSTHKRLRTDLILSGRK